MQDIQCLFKSELRVHLRVVVLNVMRASFFYLPKALLDVLVHPVEEFRDPENPQALFDLIVTLLIQLRSHEILLLGGPEVKGIYSDDGVRDRPRE
jgi:hypothetical protein